MRERAVRDLDALLAGFTEGAFVVGADGRIVLWNRGAERILGSAAREVLGRRVTRRSEAARPVAHAHRHRLIDRADGAGHVGDGA